MTQEYVKQRVQQGVEARQAVAQPVTQEDGPLQLTGVIYEEQGDETVPPDEVVGSEDDDEDDGDDNEDACDFVTALVGDGWRVLESHAYAGGSVAQYTTGQQEPHDNRSNLKVSISEADGVLLQT